MQVIVLSFTTWQEVERKMQKIVVYKYEALNDGQDGNFLFNHIAR